MDYEHYILQGEAKSTELSDDWSYLLVQKANSYSACVGQTEECCPPKIVLTYDCARYFIPVWIGVPWAKSHSLLFFKVERRRVEVEGLLRERSEGWRAR